MAWRLPNREWLAGKGAPNRRAFRKIVESGGTPGVIGYLGAEPVAWCAVAPREQYSFLSRSRVLAPVDDRPVWSVSCLFVARLYRRMGLSAKILSAAADFAARRGARAIEGYPVQTRMQKTPDPFIWTGVPSAFRKAGFREVARRSKTRPIMRRTLRARRAG